ncbi:uncharacterized protein [Temnothorax nylanderi]|uniref:uncharacterized protein n=1 Tax=Temnothorax nylanderi TaxID=102681 RepID=UPI003A871947
MSHKCKYCNALKWKEEAPGMCCSAGKVQLSPFEPLPEPLYSLVMGSHPEHVHFMNRVRKYNNCFNMTSFGAKQVLQDGFMPTFKVQGQVYHLELVKELQKMLHEVNSYIKDLKTTLEKVPPTCKKFEVIIHADKKPVDVHGGRFNAPTANEVALVIVGQQFEQRDIVLQSHDNTLRRISEIHRSYDVLQYPLLFCRGEDGYSIALPQRDPQTKLPFKNTVSAASFYSQFLVDMYAKIETERLNYIRNNQAQLRADSYIHLRDAVGKQDADVAQLGQMVVLPSSFTGGPRYMHERTQDAMTYVRYHGRPDLFITFTCNPKWKDITDVLLSGQKSHDRHDIIARVFHLKVKKMMALLTRAICLEKCVKSIKYICKYVNKGSDQATFALESERDEVKLYESGRYISSSEAIWRILAFPIHRDILLSSISLFTLRMSACKALGLLEDDKHWDNTLEEAALCDSPFKLRELFTVMLVFCQLTEPLSLWEKYKDSLSEDITRQVERELQGNAQQVMDEVYNRCLVLIEDTVLALGGQELHQYGLSQPKRSGEVLKNRDYLRETNYDVNTLAQVVSINEGLLTDEQFAVYRQVLSSIESSAGQVFFLDAPGGTGKTFLINLLLAKGGKTAHAAFKLPFNLNHAETPLCNISKQSNMAQVLQDCKLIVWVESTMAHKGGFEA